MIFIDEHNRSFWNKTLFSGCLLIILVAALGLMFADLRTSTTWLRQYHLAGDPVRQGLVATCLIIYFVRLMITVWVFQKRTWTWLETIIITVLMSFVLYTFARVGGDSMAGVGVIEVLGTLIYLSGSYINTHSEYARHVWKMKASNKGRLYTQGFFSWAMHINYFGDLVLFTGLAMVAHSLSLLVIPLIMALNFIFNIIPNLDTYLDKKYGDEFRVYSKKTKKLIPLIY